MGLIGAILGDIAGSQYEFSRPKEFDYKTVKLFDDNSFFTDDTVMSIATKVAIDNKISFTECYQKFGRLYPDAGYGGMFDDWIRENNPKPYNSFGNGSAMRVSYIGEFFTGLIDIQKMATLSAECTHNHPEGIKGAVATASCIDMAKCKCTKPEIYELMCKVYDDTYRYSVSTPLDEVRKTYRYDVTCQGTVPVAIRCFLESDDYESCIRNVFSLRSDVDTMACIAGGIAESFYGTTGLDNDALLRRYLDDRLYKIMR